MPEVGLVKFRVLFSMVLDAFILPRTYIYIFESDFLSSARVTYCGEIKLP